VVDRPPLSAEVFDTAFREADGSEWLQRVFGADLPADVDPFSFITVDGLHEIAGILAECRAGTVLDVACGRGGPGLWLVQHIGAHLIGVDFSPVGIKQASSRAADLGHDLQVRYVVADATSTGLPSDSVDGVVCIDAIQLMADRAGVMAEVCRVLRPGGQAVFTTWEDADQGVDLAALFEAAGLLAVSVEERPDWLVRERAIFERALADAPSFPDDAALQGLAEEAEFVLPRKTRRVLGVARKPR
jgi:SAM-dependent methyltransferase